MTKRLVQVQFGENAEAYGSSPIHASGSSLNRLLELVEPLPTSRVLDIATGAGHTAREFAHHAEHVIAIDLTPEMLSTAKRIDSNFSNINVDYLVSDALELPFPDRFVDVVTCRLAAHHFYDIGGFLFEMRRILTINGLFALVDNVVPGSLRSHRRSTATNSAGQYINSLDKLRDPSHVRSLSIEEWQVRLIEAGFDILHQESERKTIDFYSWVNRMGVAEDNISRLRVMLRQAPQPVNHFLRPIFSGSSVQFDITEAIFVTRKVLFRGLDPQSSGR